jgi:ribose transport system substrate-binding protein
VLTATAWGSSSHTTSSSVVSAAKKLVTQYEQAGSIGLTTPLKTKPPRGKTIVDVTGNLTAYNVVNQGMIAAAKAIGWHIKILAADVTNLTSVNTEMQAAVAEHPDFIANTTGQSEAAYASGLAAAKAAHIPVFVNFTSAPVANGIVFRDNGSNESALQGKLLEDWVIAKSNGKANEVFFAIESDAAHLAIEKSFQKTAASCSGCQLTIVPVSETQEAAGQVTSLAVSYVQSHPSVKYLMFTEGDLSTGLRAALATAGIGKNVTVGTYDTQPTNFAAMKGGHEQMSLSTSGTASSWYLVDAMARDSEGTLKPSLSNVPVPLQIFTPTHLPTIQPWPGPTNYPKQFEKLWKVS